MCNKHHRHSIFCILPPHILDQIVRNGSQDQRDWALDTLQVDHTLRSMRLVTAAPVQVLGGGTPGQVQRSIYDAKSKADLPGVLLRTEGQAKTGDVAADEAYDYLGATYDLYWDVFHRNSIDDAGLPLQGIVHYENNYDNAFWNGAQMVFGDGDGKLFNRFTASLDVIGHELTHGVTENEAGLVYFNQAGALNESISDVFGSLVKQHALKQTVEHADWLIGAELLASGVKGKALRSMAEPGTAYDDPILGKDPQPAHMKDFVKTSKDNGGVHINSGIPNRAFYLVAMALGGNAWDRAGHIWYEALRDNKLKPNAGFVAFAKLTVAHTSNAKEADAVKNAWKTVGVKV
jgi:Zn-dependent metalloprotease